MGRSGRLDVAPQRKRRSPIRDKAASSLYWRNLPQKLPQSIASDKVSNLLPIHNCQPDLLTACGLPLRTNRLGRGKGLIASSSLIATDRSPHHRARVINAHAIGHTRAITTTLSLDNSSPKPASAGDIGFVRSIDLKNSQQSSRPHRYNEQQTNSPRTRRAQSSTSAGMNQAVGVIAVEAT